MNKKINVQPILTLWRYVGLFCLPVALLPIFCFIDLKIAGLIVGSSLALFCLFACRQHRIMLRFVIRVSRFRTWSADGILVHYERGIIGESYIRQLAEYCKNEIEQLQKQFEFRLRGRIVIFLFQEANSIRDIFGPNYGGFALSQINAIGIPVFGGSPTIVRHELAHLFAARWSNRVNQVLCEGLAVWWEDGDEGQTADDYARPIANQSEFQLKQLLRRNYFFDLSRSYKCYRIAGSFTSFLIRRYGWMKYRSLYQKAGRIGVTKSFPKVYGIEMAKAEWQWRNELIVLEVLRRRSKNRFISN